MPLTPSNAATPSSDDSQLNQVDSLVLGVQQGDQAALERVFHLHFKNLVVYAKRRMLESNGEFDGEAAAASAICSFVRGAMAGRYKTIANHSELHRLLCVIVLRKAIKYRNRNRRYVQIVDRQAGENAEADSRGRNYEHLFPAGAVAEEAAIVHETLEQLLSQLGNPTLQMVVLMQLEGHSPPHIANKLNLSIRSVQRFIKKIRKTLERIEDITVD